MYKVNNRLTPYLLIAPALLIVTLLFGGGVLLALLQSFNYMPLIGLNDFSLVAWRSIFQQAAFTQSLLLTLWVAFASTLISTVLAIGCALLLRNTRRGKGLIMFIFQLNIPIPHIVGAVGILLLFSQSGLLARIAAQVGLITQPSDFPALVNDRYGIGIILEYVWKETCFTGVIVLSALQGLGEEMGQAAATLGANRWQRFRHITLPLIAPAIFSASILVFAFSFGAYEVPFLLGQRFPSMLPVLAYRSYTDIDLTARPEAMAMSMIIAIIITVLILIYQRIINRNNQ